MGWGRTSVEMNAMSAEAELGKSIDYQSCRYGASRISFRGPLRKIRGDYFVCVGSSETYGMFTKLPFPDLIEQNLGTPTVNLGCHKASIDAFNTSPGLIDICSMAKVTVVQIMGALNMSNRFYTVDPRHNERFVRASKRFKQIYPEIDFTTFRTNELMLGELARTGPDRIHLVRQEVQSAWVARMRTLLGQIDGKKVLLWASDHTPYCLNKPSTICRNPLFIDRAMLDAVKDYADAYVEVVGTPGEIHAGRSELVYSQYEESEAKQMLGGLVHERIARELEPVVMALLHDLPAPTMKPRSMLAS